jgi:hypothetical protein
MVSSRAYPSTDVRLIQFPPLAIVSLEKQIRIPYSQRATVGLTHPNVVLMQQYLALSPKCEDILLNWKHGNEVRHLLGCCWERN